MNIPSSIKIGSHVITPPVILAPMEDVTNQAFRRIVKRIANPGLMFTEFVSAMAIHHGAEKTLHKMRIHDEERPVGIQIFGGDADVMAETARKAEELGADIVDINMGCWVPKVCRTGSGAALLKDPDLAERIVQKVVNAVNVPVTVKVRAGWDYSMFAAPELAQRFENAGAQMITLHARFAKQGFDGKANWQLIQDLKHKVKIPVIGNGDIKTPEDAIQMFKETGCDGIMVGRAAISNPWALAKITSLWNGQAAIQETLKDRVETALEHAQLMIAHEAGVNNYHEALQLPTTLYQSIELKAIRSLRGQLPLYIKHEPGASKIRASLTQCSSYQELSDILNNFLLVSNNDLSGKIDNCKSCLSCEA
jgi:tRNA-dihydrouridine synthase B